MLKLNIPIMIKFNYSYLKLIFYKNKKKKKLNYLNGTNWFYLK